MRIGWTTDTVTTDASRALHYTLLWGLEGVVLRAARKATGNEMTMVTAVPMVAMWMVSSNGFISCET